MSPEQLSIAIADKEEEEDVTKMDPNAAADHFVNDIGAPYPAVHSDESSPSEDFFTVGE